MHGKLIAAVLACGGPTVISHRSAAALWQIGDFLEPIEVTRPRGGRSWRPGIRIHQPRDFERIKSLAVRGIPVTSVPRTLFDCSSVVDFETLEDMAATAHRRGLITGQELRATLAENIRRPGAVAFSELVSELDLDVLATRSRMERKIIRLCVNAGIRKPQAGVMVAGFEVDLLWEEEKLIVEFDSGAFHSDFAAIERDRARDARHTWHGYRVFRVTYRMLQREPGRVIAQIRRLLATPPPA
jgi:very-short-patch-repair endonuclease